MHNEDNKLLWLFTYLKQNQPLTRQVRCCSKISLGVVAIISAKKIQILSIRLYFRFHGTENVSLIYYMTGNVFCFPLNASILKLYLFA